MNTIEGSNENTIVNTTTNSAVLPINIETAPVKVQLRMTPEEIREFVAKARAKDAEARERVLAEKEKTD
jgi:hypothetical protein